MPSVRFQQDYLAGERDTLPYLVRGLKRSHHLAPLLVRSLDPYSRGKRLRDATRTSPDSTDSRRLAYRSLPDETERFPSARSERHAARIVVRTRTRSNTGACLPKR